MHALYRYLIVVLAGAALLTLPWLESKPFHTKGEPREAITAQAMMASDNWILPLRYGSDIATKPPLLHWLIGAASALKGEVTEGTSRLPSALGYLLGGMAFFVFVRRNENAEKAVVATFFLLTTLQWSHGPMTARVDMLLTGCTVWALLALFRWEERKLKGIPWYAVAAMSLAALTKGPVGIVLPCMVLFAYLLLLRYPFRRLFWAVALAGLLSAIVPALWYLAAWKIGGEQFLAIVYDENIARFTGTMKLGGEHRNSNLYMLGTLLSGMLPWSLPALMAGVIALKTLKRPQPGFLKRWGTSLLAMEKHKLFSVVAVVSMLLFYAIPASKRAAYLMPVYPFLVLFITDLFFKLTKNRNRLWLLFERLIGGAMILFVLIITLFLFGFYPPLSLFPQEIAPSVAFYSDLMSHLYYNASITDILVTFTFLVLLILWSRRQSGPEGAIPRAPFLAAVFSFILYMNAFFQPQVGTQLSVKTFAEKIGREDPAGTLYYSYGKSCFVMSFYLNSRFLDFLETKPESGILILGEQELAKLRAEADSSYRFSIIEKSPHPFTDIRQAICRVEFQKTVPQ